MSPRQEGRVVSLQDIVAEPIGPDVYELVVDDDLIGVLRMKAVVPNQRKPIRKIFRIE